MDAKGDITDTFDDEEFTKSVEAGKAGPWNDESVVFEDPKFAKLKKELAVPKETDYRQRRLNELQERGLKNAAQPKQRATTPQSEFGQERQRDPQESVWSEDDTAEAEPRQNRRSTAHEPDPDSLECTAMSRRRNSDRQASRGADTGLRAPGVIGNYGPSLFAAMLVFGAATATHGVLAGWQLDLVWRASAAMLLTGILWRRFQAERPRAMAIATGTYSLLFVSPNRLELPASVFALFLGLFVVSSGAALLGVQRNDWLTHKP